MGTTRVKSLTLRLARSAMPAVVQELKDMGKSQRVLMRIHRRKSRVTVKPPDSVVFKDDEKTGLAVTRLTWHNGRQLEILDGELFGMKFNSLPA